MGTAPTLPYTATPLVGPDDDRETYVARALTMVANTAPFDASGHPVISVPAGLVNGLPAGLMIVGRRSCRCADRRGFLVVSA